MSTLLAPGSRAPDFAAPASDGRTYWLSQMLAQRVLLIFYPGNNTPG
jgi:peroxiredoxin